MVTHRTPRGYSLVTNLRLPNYLYHATNIEQLDTIKSFGIIRGFSGGLDPERDIDFVWLDAQLEGLKKFLRGYYAGDWIIIQIKTRDLNPKKLYRKRFGDGIIWYAYKGNIAPRAISKTIRLK